MGLGSGRKVWPGEGPLQALGRDFYLCLEKQLTSHLPEGHALQRTGGRPTKSARSHGEQLTPSRPVFYFSLFCQQSSCHLEAFFPQQWIFLCAVLGAGNAGSEETCDMWPFGLNESHSDLQTRPTGH